MREIEWTDTALEDMAALDKAIARRVKHAVERVAETGAGNVKKLQGLNPAEYRLRVGDYRAPVGGQDRSHFPYSEPPRRLPLSQSA